MDRIMEILHYLGQVDSWSDFVAWYSWIPLWMQVVIPLGVLGVLMFFLAAIMYTFSGMFNNHS